MQRNQINAPSAKSAFLPNGAFLFAEVHSAKLVADKKPITGSDGFFVADQLPLYTAMARNAGCGKDIPDMLRNEDWNYQAAPAWCESGGVSGAP